MRATDLTALAEKGAVYESDRWFQAGLDAASAHLDWSSLRRVATITAKAEAVATRQLDVTFEFLRRHGFAIAAAREVWFDASNVHQMWMYHWNVATPDRRALAQDLLSMGPALFLVVVDESSPCRIPGPARLSALKGSAYPSRRRPGQLRNLVGAQGRMLTFIHTADEPADVLREAALLFSDAELEELFGEVAGGGGADDAAVALRERLYACSPERSMDPAAAYAAMRQGLEDVARAQDEKGQEARAAIAILEADRDHPGDLPWRQLKGHVLAARPGLDLWDPILYATERVRHDQPGAQPDLQDGTAEDWEAIERAGAP